MVVIHGSTRCQTPVSWCLYHLTERKRCSSIPRCLTSRGRSARAFSSRAVASRIIFWTVGHDTQNWSATRATARTSPATASVIASRSRRVRRERGGTCSVCSVNVARGHRGSAQRHRFLTHSTLT